jgi:formylglycine-generating enzyme required for sulfatase activity
MSACKTPRAIAGALIVAAMLATSPLFASGAAFALTPVQEKALKPGEVFKDCDRCPEMVVVPAGRFVMGAGPNDTGVSPSARKSEEPQREVTIARPLAVGRFEALGEEFRACMEQGGCKSWQSPNTPEGRHPMAGLTWYMAKEFVAWLAKTTGKPYRLLSEAEWEYAARAGTATAYYTGASISQQQARFGAGTGGKGNVTLDVGKFPPNAFGLYDMAGNVEEWVEDCFNDNYQGALTDGSAWLSGTCDIRMARGGDYFGSSVHVRSAARNGFGATSRSFGFRVARGLSQ